MKWLILPVFVLSVTSSGGQVAVIHDPDGYTNVRKSPEAQSEIVHRIFENEVFWYNEEESENEWVPVIIHQNDFSLDNAKYPYIDGFVHKSRLMPLAKLTPYEGDAFQFEYTIAPFDSTGRVIGRMDGFVDYIDGRRIWGTDGSFPRTEVSEIKVSANGPSIEIHPVFYRDLFECTNSFKVYRNGDAWFVWQMNSDGAGAYELVWVFTKSGLKQRLVGRGVY